MKGIPTIDCMIDFRPGGLARARQARAKSDFTLAVELAQQSMRIADQARALIK